MNHTKRSDIARTIFVLLDKEKPPFLVIGNLGFALATLLRCLRQFDEETGLRLEDQLQILCSADQKLMCIFKNKEGQSISQKDLTGNPECLCIDISWTGCGVAQSTTRDDHSDITGISRNTHYLKMLSIGEDVEELRGARTHFDKILLAHIKLRPVVSSSSKPDYTGAIDVDATLKMLDNSFKLLKHARAQAGVHRDKKSLDDKEFQVAHDWLSQTFKDYFIENDELYYRVNNARVDNLTGKQKKNLKDATRGAFRTWKRSLVGKYEFLMAVLRNGLFDSQSQQDLLLAVLQERSQHKGEQQPSEREQKEFRKKALAARKKLRDARKLAAKDIPESDLSKSQIQMLHELDIGVLEDNMLEMNQAYKHGEGVKIRTREEAAVFRMSCNELGAYWAS